MLSNQAFTKLYDYEFETVLDIGCGTGEHATIFRKLGKQVTAIALSEPADIVCDFNYANLPMYDCLWASHVLEHQANVGRFLDRCFYHLNENGILAITVPPLKHEIVGGHVSLWNAGLLLYNLILAGFNCKQAAVKSYGYNISVIVRKDPILLPRLNMDGGDIVTLAEYFPIDVREGFDGQLESINW